MSDLGRDVRWLPCWTRQGGGREIPVLVVSLFHGIGGAFRAYDLLKWASTFSSVEEVHLWGGFPCVHLRSVRSNRRSLEGDGSNSILFYRLLKLEMAEPFILEFCHGTMGH